MIERMWEFNRITKGSATSVKIINNDTRDLEFIDDQSIDFICTHPPYMTAVPYAEYQKLSLWWSEIITRR